MNTKPLVTLFAVALLAASCGRAPENGPGSRDGSGEGFAGSDWQAAAREAMAKGANYLAGARTDGKWAFYPDKPADLGTSALATWGLLAAQGEPSHAVAKPVLDWLVSFQKDDGAIFDQALATYITSATVMGLVETGDPKYTSIVEKAMQFLRRVQADDGEGRDESSEDYGGIGYGSGGAATGVVNMSTTQFAIDAARAGGMERGSDFYLKALRFLERSQNRSESNDLTHKAEVDGVEVEVVPANDGGAIYRPGDSKAGLQKLADGRYAFRSYGSMTYALLKSYILCDLDARDPRVKAALEWIAANWELDYNPGMEHSKESADARYQGLYYYYMTIARTLAVCERQRVKLPAELAGWREELARKLIAMQREDGSWINETDRWREDSRALCTGYVLVALAECVKGEG